MKVKDLFKKASQYNEVAQMIGKENLIVRMEMDGYDCKDFNSFNEFKEWLKEEIIDDLAQKILEDNSYENNKEIKYERKYLSMDGIWYATFRFWLV